MAKTTVDLLELSDSQKTEFLGSARTYLKQQVEEKRYYSSISLSSLEKDNMGLEFNLTVKGKNEMSTFKSTIEKIRSLEEEKKSLLLEIEELKKMSEAKATALECEVNALRDEVKSLKTLMTGSEPKPDRFKK
jgi:hypothetical protein